MLFDRICNSVAENKIRMKPSANLWSKRAPINIKIYKDKTVSRSSYLYNGNIILGKTALYWDGALFIFQNQYHSCWWPGYIKSQVISSHGIDQFFRNLPASVSNGVINWLSSTILPRLKVRHYIPCVCIVIFMTYLQYLIKFHCVP